MKKIIFSALSVIALASCLVQCGPSPIKDPTRLINLPVEVQMIIYKDLNLTDLIQVAKTHPQNQAAVELTFKDKYSKSKLIIDNSKYGYATAASIVSRDNVTDEIDLDATLDAIQLFGHLMQKLRISYRPLLTSRQIGMLNEHISKYLSDSLAEITLEYFSDTNLVELRGPFTKVENLTLASGYILSNTANLSQIFPALKRLYFTRMQYKSLIALKHHFPHLKFIEFDTALVSYSPHGPSIFELNSQLRHLSFLWADWKVLDVVSKYAPNLERLEIYDFRELLNINRQENVNLNNLKSFTIRISHHITPYDIQKIPIVFGNLEEFACDQPIVNALVQNKQLKKLTMGYMVDEQIERMIGRFPHLEEFTMDFHNRRMHTDNSIRVIHKFVNQTNKLKKLSFFRMTSNTSNALIKQLTPQWSVTTKGEKLFFRRD